MSDSDEGGCLYWLALLIIVVLVLGMTWCNTKRNCADLMRDARTHADTLVVLTSRPYDRGVNCKVVLQ